MAIQNVSMNVPMGFLKEAGEFCTGVADKIKLVWDGCLPALKQIAAATVNFFTAHKKEAIYIGVGLGVIAAIIAISIAVKKIYDYCATA